MSVTREQILSRRTPATKVTIDGYGDFYIRRLTLSEIKSWQADNKASEFKTIFDGLVGRALSDDTGKRIFQDNQIQEVSDALEYQLIRSLYDKAVEFNGLASKDEAKTKSDLAQDAKN